MGNMQSVRPNGRPLTKEPQLHFYNSRLLRDCGYCSKILLHPHAVFGSSFWKTADYLKGQEKQSDLLGL